MVCTRCKIVVRYELEKLGLHCTALELGKVEIREMLSVELIDKIKIALLQSGLELIDNKRSILVEKIIKVIVELVYSNDQLKINFSDYLSEKLDFDYTYLSNIFSEAQGTTIEHFLILQRITRVKELINYNELSLTEISWKLHYSSVAHLSSQFKKVTGVTPSQYKTVAPKAYMAF